MTAVEHAMPGTKSGHRGLQGLREFCDLGTRMLCTTTDDDQRPLALVEQRRGLLDQCRIRCDGLYRQRS